ncbi:DNA mismatch repair endonuclease MutL [Chengkuizengella axinellae]|uniref:DNA mismatch repair protein MutL n=1 Tax=Chengkuizengella axinellae TaxID=3064388 RepID=A0ABT9IX77_9BACL|nr:DNA mismatch repair endonuclease MutL [Chengkuizengella sp. 2205SS18-9]MDP5273969.1 DNA mismatch repair endonuclease MutL [Chengkuizengella sp. 2205SS18-9]
MGKIHILEEQIANQIAAGEVVERPSSVVKELVENSIDAGSTKIDIVIEEGGLQSIRVTDNGSGIEKEDCELAFLPHATSKISSSKDLFQIRSLGFRGEALPSISAVSKMSCITSTENTGLGYKVVNEGGVLKAVEETRASKGTDITVKELFYNTPARLKYVKTIQTELGHISDYIYRLALAYPDIRFTLTHNGKTLLQTLGNGDLLQVIAAIYGRTVAKAMIQVTGSNMDYSLSGYIAKPEMTRSNRSSISFIVNGRYIRNPFLNKAILNAYHTLLPIHRYPICVLHIQMDPTLLDVNVHPAKLEVRFSKEKELMVFLEQELRKSLQKQVLIPAAKEPKSEKTVVIQEKLNLYSAQPQHSTENKDVTSEGFRNDSLTKNESVIVNSKSEGITDNIAKDQSILRDDNDSIQNHRQQYKPYDDQRFANTNNKSSREAVNQFVSSQNQTNEVINHSLPEFPKLHPIGQMHGTYVLAQNESGLYLIDQHAAHERINYEYYYYKFGNPEPISQELLIPITLEFTPTEAELLKDRLIYFEQVGVQLEFFGGNAFRVGSYPYWFPKGEEKEIITEMAEWVLTEKKAIDIAKLREKSSILCSCKASIKANQYLSISEIEALLDKLTGCRNPYTCPHGRPIVISFSTYELEKMFKRVM